MGANDSPTTTRSIITDYFDWRLNNKTITNNRVFTLVRKLAAESEAAYRDKQPTIDFRSSISPIDLHTLNNIKNFHYELGKEYFCDGIITWGRIITFITFSALLAEDVIRQQTDSTSKNLIVSSMIDWTTEFVDTELQTWLESQNSWSGFLKSYDRTPQRRNSISRYAGILGTIGMLTLGALYMRRT